MTNIRSPGRHNYKCLCLITEPQLNKAKTDRTDKKKISQVCVDDMNNTISLLDLMTFVE